MGDHPQTIHYHGIFPDKNHPAIEGIPHLWKPMETPINYTPYI